ncbi:Obg family GTPase CgtA [Dictyocaulus viviparus]|uniref:Obg family GTPase CgtA n=1 Tax=Dictyocaulus viviparus TaxID=29172 RepID=A0A0D8XXH9_DICVI|nr:Obg family GTPase CgtA [Dictyocaulus viviparus]
MHYTKLLRNFIKQTQKIIGHDLNILERDEYIIRAIAGSGGGGLPRYDGIGGKGGNVYLVSTNNMSFTDIKRNLKGKMKVKAGSGAHSQKIKLVGKDGADVCLQVPIGTEAVDVDRNILLARCTQPFQKYLIARGGAGADLQNNYIPEKGEQLNVSLNLKLRPNVGLVGFPNAGKSTLMKALVPRKYIKIAPYPFTTIKPQVAFWTAERRRKDVGEDFTLSLADLPGLIEGASRNRGKGYKFLKHLEYADILLFIVDCTGFQLSNNLYEAFRSPIEVVALLNCEIENYSRKLVNKPAVLLFNKIDLVQDKDIPCQLVEKMRSTDWPSHVSDQLRPQFPINFAHVLAISAKLGKVDDVKKALIRMYRDIRPTLIPENDFGDTDKRLL